MIVALAVGWWADRRRLAKELELRPEKLIDNRGVQMRVQFFD